MTGPAIVENILGAIAEVEGTEPENLELSLEDYISVDAIQMLVRHNCDCWRLVFETPNHVIEVTEENTILVDGEHRRTLT